jgi:hypothetical protein
VRRGLRSACLSNAGIEIAMRSWSKRVDAGLADTTEYKAIEQEVGDAAHASPVDLVRLEKALQARDELAVRRQVSRHEEVMEVLKQLSPSDRAIYARRLSLYRPTMPPKTCPAN